MTSIGIDSGISTTDFVVMESNELVFSQIFEEINIQAIKELIGKYFPEKIVLTGCNALKIFDELSEFNPVIANELECVGNGAEFISKETDFVVANAGSGTAFVDWNGKATHLGGIGIGGKTLAGIALLSIGTDNWNELEKLAGNGNLKNIDLELGDIYSEELGLLKKDSTVVHFGKAGNNSKEDIAVGLFNLVSQAIAVGASFACRSIGKKKIVFTGKVSESKIAQKLMKEKVGVLVDIEFIFPKNSGLATAIGAALQ